MKDGESARSWTKYDNFDFYCDVKFLKYLLESVFLHGSFKIHTLPRTFCLIEKPQKLKEFILCYAVR